MLGCIAVWLQGGSTIKPVAGSSVYDDDGVGNSKAVDGEKYCLDVALGGNLEVWTAPLINGKNKR